MNRIEKVYLYNGVLCFSLKKECLFKLNVKLLHLLLF